MVWRCWRQGSGWRRISRVCAWFVGRVLWPVRVLWRGGPSAQKTRVLGGRNAPLYHTGTTQCCSYGLDDRQCHSNGPISQVGQWLHAISWRLHTRGKERQGYQRNGVQTARKATSGLAGCICSKSVPMTRGWQGQVAVSQVRHAVSWRLLHTRGKERQGDQRNGVQTA